MLNPKKLDDLLCKLQSSNVFERRKAASRLSGSKDPRAVQALMQACDDQDVGVRVAAVSGLRASKVPEATMFLQSRSMEFRPSQRDAEALKSRARRNMMIGALFMVGGAIATFIGYSVAAHSATGGTYFVFWGAMIFGFVDLVRGALAYSKASRRSG